MRLITTVLVAGVIGTLMMDALNFLASRLGLISKIDVGAIGRMAAGWTRGRFRYGHPREMAPLEHDVLFGYLAHHAIGIGLAGPFLLAWVVAFDALPSPLSALLYGLATTVVSWCVVYPSMGFRVFGLGSPEGIRAPISSLANHLFYGMGLALGVALA